MFKTVGILCLLLFKYLLFYFFYFLLRLLFPTFPCLCFLSCSVILLAPFSLLSCSLSLLTPMADHAGSSNPHFFIPKGTIFEGHGWRSAYREKNLPGLREEFGIPENANVLIPSLGCCDDEGYAGKTALFAAMFSHGLKLPFCHPLHDILGLLELASAQLHPHSYRTYLCACIVYLMVLEPLGDVYPDLIARKFLTFYHVRSNKGNIASFCKRDKIPTLAHFEGHHFNAKAWNTKFFFITGTGKNFLAREARV